ncbi:TPA: hypothetical protein UM515_000701 [Stenotrophomonas maltophilia]|uniref:hypothetical protein n=1 Tax=Stenotrophomonas maltophilia TaxID=40324 RepID=UPI0013DA68CA|nr:hypothetical protein [Stenotrophomonas maltophilia]MBH1660077.1 hypothetical protein [Stenotrophomonas maltophilia]MBH1732839.1 hypothetical protein [Stenotrophomonas maltophilia]HEL3247501.1 hypothetical protein [Stenotrophomonas maltophilia]HEL4261060.1 hypothetical protein [Stenotrophomonas maltophilia]
MADQLLLFPVAPIDVEDAVQKILALRRKYCCSGHAGEDIELIRATLMKERSNG